ncbi:MAG: hypothetical protein EPO62_02470 [Candidatus Nitrosotenuis sp.]|nr:MAG: hypothetical protein EPO62_02470 [Candidatus Nitrosotenuis sp.]
MIEQSSKYYALALMSLLVTATLLPSLTSQHAFAATSTGIMIPLYTYPGTTWDTVVAAKNAHPSVPIVAIINPNNGPGGAKDSNYVSGIQKLQSAGIVVIGYVATGYGSRSTSTVNSDIDTYKSWYPQLQGIFFDEMSNGGGDETYYGNLSNHSKSVGFAFTVGNPGAETQSSYIGTMDNIIIYETGGLPSLSFLGGWHTGYDKSNFSYLSYGVGTLDTSFVQSSANYVSYMYITNDNLSNPWDSVTPYFSDLAAALDTGIIPPPPPPPSPTQTVTVQSTDLAGNTLTGLWTEISAVGILVGSGYTTFTYDAISGTQYQVCVADYGNNVFDHWDDGSTNSCRTITPTQATTLTASYQTGAIPPPPPPPSPTQTVTVQSTDLAGNTLTGLWTEISAGSTLVSSGYTTMTYDATTGTQYQVCVSNYQTNVFDHWDDGSTNSCRTITPTQATTLTAYYKTSVAIKVKSKDLSGNAITGLWTEIYSGTKLVKSGYTTLSYTGKANTQYKVCMSNYQNYVFDHWGDGSTNSCKTITPTQATTLTAFYMR